MNDRERMVRFAQASMRMIENLTARYDADLIERIDALVPPVRGVYQIPREGAVHGSWRIELFAIDQRGALRANIDAVETAEMFRAAIPEACRILAGSEGANNLIDHVNEKWNKVTEARCVLPGEYVRLVTSEGECIMSDTHSERLDGCDFVEAAHGAAFALGFAVAVTIISGGFSL